MSNYFLNKYKALRLIVNYQLLNVSRGFTLVEVIVVMGVMVVLMGLATINLLNAQHKASLSSTIDIFMADLKEQQVKAMVGDTEGRSAVDAYGMHFATTGYTLFHGPNYKSGDSTNYVPSFPTTIQISSAIPTAQIVFASGSGEFANFAAGTNTVTFTDTTTSEARVVTVNRMGVVVGIN